MNFIFNKTTVSFFIIMLIMSNIYSQNNYKFEGSIAPLKSTITPRNIDKDWMFEIQNLEMPSVGNKTYNYFLEEAKKEVDEKYNSKSFIPVYNSIESSSIIDTPIVNYAFEGNHYSGSVPNDNTMAISNDGIVVASINTNIIFYDTKQDSLLKTISLRSFSDTLVGISSHQYDPKAIYDYENDRFVLVYLAGTDSPTNIIVAFSSTNNPMDEWYLYSLAGNPLNDTSWSDYPAISMSHGELFITMNLLVVGGQNWQTSFKQSVIWQINKEDGYNGDSLRLGLHSGIGTDGIPVRNIHPIRGGDSFYGPEMYFLSERNFDIENDTFFVIKTFDKLSGDNKLEVTPVRADQKYGMPPNAYQKSTYKRLSTNDSRVLGGFYQNGFIQFVGNSVDALTGHASFYHGIFKPTNLNEKIHLNIFTDSLLQFGYPNLSYCGKNDDSKNSIITVNYSSKKSYPGMGAIFYKKDDLYSKITKLKEGNTHINILAMNQRWGDYSGSQPKYNKPGEVWASATFGKYISGKNAYGTWIASLSSPFDAPALLPPGEEIASNVYPNPSANEFVSVDFIISNDRQIEVKIFDITGKLVGTLYEGRANKGKNTCGFSTLSLSSGIYFLIIESEGDRLKTHKISVL